MEFRMPSGYLESFMSRLKFICSSFLISFLQIMNINDNDKDDGNESDGKCELVGTFSLVTQAILGLLCISSLIVKRYYEYPVRRTWSVWSLDVSKQLIGASGVHVFNVLLSIIKTRKSSDGGPLAYSTGSSEENPCDWYFLNIIFDCTIGVYVLYLVFLAENKICKEWFNVTEVESGQYGPDPNHPSLSAFFKQLGVYFSSLMVTKFILYGMVVCFEEQLLWITSNIILVWLDEYPDEFEIFIVMFVVPIFMNCLQLVLIDNFIRNQIISKANNDANTQNEITAVQGETIATEPEVARLSNPSDKIHLPTSATGSLQEGDNLDVKHANSQSYGTFDSV